MTKTQQIFRQDAPVKNQFQTGAKRLLFVCSVGMLRSPTAQVVASTMGFNARACGSDVDCALIPISANLIEWADQIIFMTFENYCQALNFFESSGWDEEIRAKKIIWNIDDDFDWGDPILYNICIKKLKELKCQTMLL